MEIGLLVYPPLTVALWLLLCFLAFGCDAEADEDCLAVAGLASFLLLFLLACAAACTGVFCIAVLETVPLAFLAEPAWSIGVRLLALVALAVRSFALV